MPDSIRAWTSDPRIVIDNPSMSISVPSGAGGTIAIPKTVSGLITWADLSDASTLFTDTTRLTAVASDGDAIAGVTDKSGVGNHLSQATAANRPLYKVNILNLKSVGRWDATNDALFSGAFVGGDKAQPNTIFAVGKSPTGATNNIFIDGLTAGKRQALYHRIDDKYYVYAGGSEIGGGVADTSFHIYAGIFNGASSKIYVAGGAAAASGDAGSNVMDGVTLGAASSGASAWLGGDIAEALVYTGALSTANLDIIGNYLATKYALTWSASS